MQPDATSGGGAGPCLRLPDAQLDYQTLSSITSLPPEALDWLDEAVTHAILQESEEHFGLFEFRHHLIREVLLEELTNARRMRFHQAPPSRRCETHRPTRCGAL